MTEGTKQGTWARREVMDQEDTEELEGKMH